MLCKTPRLSQLLCGLIAFLPATAMAAEPVCLTQQEATALIAYALPQAISGTAKRCATTLPKDAFLNRQGAQLASRYAVQKERYWPQARPAFLKALNSEGGQQAGFIRSLPEESMRQMADVFVEGFVSQRIAVKSCDQLDSAIQLLSPLPPENTAGLIALTMEIASTADPKLGKVSFCKT